MPTWQETELKQIFDRGGGSDTLKLGLCEAVSYFNIGAVAFLSFSKPLTFLLANILKRVTDLKVYSV